MPCTVALEFFAAVAVLSAALRACTATLSTFLAAAVAAESTLAAANDKILSLIAAAFGAFNLVVVAFPSTPARNLPLAVVIVSPGFATCAIFGTIGFLIGASSATFAVISTLGVSVFLARALPASVVASPAAPAPLANTFLPPCHTNLAPLRTPLATTPPAIPIATSVPTFVANCA